MRKWMRKIHLILSLPSGIVISIICLTGALMSVDEYVRPIWPAWQGIYRNLMFLHRWLLFPDRPVGKLIVGISTVFLIVILISGLIIWLPKKWGKVKSNLVIKRNTKWGRKLLDLHRVLGVYSMLLLLVMSLTGLMWSFEGYRNTMTSIFTVDRVPERVAIANRVNKETGENIRIDFNEKPNSSKVMRWAYLLHTGRWGGWFGPLVTGLSALIGASLPITGYVLYFRRIRRRKAKA